MALLHRTLLTTLLMIAFSLSSATAAEWGDLTGRFVYKGKPPARKELDLKGDEYCGPFKPLDPFLIVDKDGGIQNVIASLYVNYKLGGKPPTPHPSFNATADAKVVLDNTKCQFEPHVAFIRVSQTVILRNSDNVGHNVNFSAFTNPSFNIVIPAKSQVTRKFSLVERNPANISCNIHPWMTAQIVIRDHPYVAITDEKGKFTIKNLPAGQHTFQFRHAAGYIQEVEQAGKAKVWKRGRPQLRIEAGKVTDLGDVVVLPKLFN